MKYQNEINELIKYLGGENNIISATHCITRLRLVLKDEKIVQIEELENMNLVKGTFSANGQFQIILGQGIVNNVYAELIEVTNLEIKSKTEVNNDSAKKLNGFQKLIRVLGDIFIPILPVIVTAGLLMGLNNILVNPIFNGMSFVEMYPLWADFASMINVIASTVFIFLPAFIGWSAAKRFGGSEILGLALGLLLIHPDLLNAWDYGNAKLAGEIPVWNLFGLEIEKIGYQGQVLPVLVATWVLVQIELFLKKRINESYQILVIGPLSLLITGFLTFIIIGPITFMIGQGIVTIITTIFEILPFLGGLLYGALYAPLVITGMHHLFLGVDLQLLGTVGETMLWPILVISNIAQGSAALGMAIVNKQQKEKGIAIAAAVSAYLGITEPAMFGINLRYMYPFIIAIITSGLIAAFISLFGVVATSIGVGGIPGILSIAPEHWFIFVIGMVLAIVLPLSGTILYGKSKLKRAKNV